MNVLKVNMRVERGVIVIKYTVVCTNDLTAVSIPNRNIFFDDKHKKITIDWRKFNSDNLGAFSDTCRAIYGRRVDLNVAENKSIYTKAGHVTEFTYHLSTNPIKAMLLLRHLVAIIATKDIHIFYFEDVLVAQKTDGTKIAREYTTGFVLVEQWMDKIRDLARIVPAYRDLISAFDNYINAYQTHKITHSDKGYHCAALAHARCTLERKELDAMLTLEQNKEKKPPAFFQSEKSNQHRKEEKTLLKLSD